MSLQVPVANRSLYFYAILFVLPARQTLSMNIPALALFKQPKHFLVLPQKCENHPRAETETFLSRPQPSQNQKLSLWEPWLEYLHLKVCICQEVCVSLCVSSKGF